MIFKKAFLLEIEQRGRFFPSYISRYAELGEDLTARYTQERKWEGLEITPVLVMMMMTIQRRERKGLSTQSYHPVLLQHKILNSFTLQFTHCASSRQEAINPAAITGK